MLPVRDRADVGQTGEHRQPTAAEVDDVHAELVRPVGEGEGEHDRPHRPGLARPGPADHGEVTGGVREVDRKRVAALQVRPVDHADGHLQRPAGHGYRETPSRPDRRHAEHLVEGWRRVQWGQPRPMCRGSPPDHRRDRRVEHCGAVRLRLRRRPHTVRPTRPARKR